VPLKCPINETYNLRTISAVEIVISDGSAVIMNVEWLAEGVR
jgi:hypothetical protein